MKIRTMGAKLFHADRHDEANSRFSQFWKRGLKIHMPRTNEFQNFSLDGFHLSLFRVVHF